MARAIGQMLPKELNSLQYSASLENFVKRAVEPKELTSTTAEVSQHWLILYYSLRLFGKVSDEL